MATTKVKPARILPVMTPTLTVMPPNTVRLNIKRAELDKIVWGDKRVEYRDDTDFYASLFFSLEKEDDKAASEVKQYAYALLYVERQKETHCALVKLSKVIYDQYLDAETGEDLDDAYYFQLEISEIVAHNLPNPFKSK